MEDSEEDTIVAKFSLRGALQESQITIARKPGQQDEYGRDGWLFPGQVHHSAGD
jgi:hypothetical protein